MNRIAMHCALLGFLCAAAPISAQQSATNHAPPALVDPLRIKAAKDMLAATRAVRSARMGAALGFEAMFNATLDKSPIASDKELLGVVRQTGLNQMSLALDELVPKLIDYMALSYASRLTSAEMQQATDFYRSSTGQKLLDLTPAMAAEANAKMQEWIKPYLPGIEDAVKKALVDALAKRKKPEAQQ